MILVIADDLTGAVELGGIALRYGLSVKVSLDIDLSANTDVLIIATDTRSNSEEKAVAIIRELSEQIASASPEFIYKKIDSALRGYIALETAEQLAATGLKKALLVPGNPAMGRVIRNGRYFINNKPINETAFRDDHEFPAESALVSEILKSEKIWVKSCNEALPDGITIGETESAIDLEHWLKKVDHDVLIGGGAAFFDVLLACRYQKKILDIPVSPATGKTLYVSGTAFADSVSAISRSANTCYLPHSLVVDPHSRDELHAWISETKICLDKTRLAIVALNPHTKIKLTALQVREQTATAVRELLSQTTIDELVIEGGSTASAILKALGIKAIYPEKEFSQGIVKSLAPNYKNLKILLKPGSYKWPPELQLT